MKHRKKKTSTDLVNHFQKRCLERVGIILSQRTLKDLLNKNKMEMLGKHSNSRTLFILRKGCYPDKPLFCDVVLAYDKLRHAFVTVMVYDEWRKNHDTNGNRTDLSDQKGDCD